MKREINSDAAVSAYIEGSAFKLTCAIYGPKSKPKTYDQKDPATVFCKLNETYLSPSSAKPCDAQIAIEAENAERDRRQVLCTKMSSILENTILCVAYPNCEFVAKFDVVETDGNTGSLLHQLCLAASAALVSTHQESIKTRTTLLSCFACAKQGTVYVDSECTEERLKDSELECFVCYDPTYDEIVMLETKSGKERNPEEVSDIVDLCIDGCKAFHELFSKI